MASGETCSAPRLLAVGSLLHADTLLQVHVGVAALERDTTILGGEVIARSDLKIRNSTWIFEGELVKGNRAEGRAGQWRLLRIIE